MNAKSKWHVGVEEIVTDDFRTGQCSCGVYVQGSKAAWQQHRRIIHRPDGRTDIKVTPY